MWESNEQAERDVEAYLAECEYRKWSMVVNRVLIGGAGIVALQWVLCVVSWWLGM